MSIGDYFGQVFSLSAIVLMIVFLIWWLLLPALIYHRLGRIYEVLWVLFEDKDKEVNEREAENTVESVENKN